MTLLCFLSCIKDYSPIISKDRSMGLWEREADTKGSRVAGQVGFKSHVQTLIAVRCIINSYNLPQGPAKPTYPLQTGYYQLSPLSPSGDPNGQLPWFRVHFVPTCCRGPSGIPPCTHWSPHHTEKCPHSHLLPGQLFQKYTRESESPFSRCAII